MKKLNNTPIAVAEKGIADFVKTLPAISDILGENGEEIPVYAATDESAQHILESRIMRGLKQCIVIGFQRTDSVEHSAAQLTAGCVFSITISSPGLLAENAIRTTTDLGCAIIAALDGTTFDAPFSPSYPCVLQSWAHNVDDNGSFLSVMEYKAPVFLK